jgi:hypothetical protein
VASRRHDIPTATLRNLTKPQQYFLQISPQSDSRTPVLVNTDFHWPEFQETAECRQIAVHITCTKFYPYWEKNVESVDKTARKAKTAVRVCCIAVQGSDTLLNLTVRILNYFHRHCQ